MSKARNISNLFSASTDLSTDAEVTAALSTHSSAADPHTVYLKESEYMAAGKNFLLNSGFDFWQRGLTFSDTGASNKYTADRWAAVRGGWAAGQKTERIDLNKSEISITAAYGARISRIQGNTSTVAYSISQCLEEQMVSMLAGQTVTFSFYARKSSSYTGTAIIIALLSGTAQFGPGDGVTGLVSNELYVTPSLSWTRHSITATVASNAKGLGISINGTCSGTAPANDYLEIAGAQLEVGGVATSFSRAAGNMQNELAACQRYFYRVSAAGGDSLFSMGSQYTSTANFGFVQMPVTMRVAPSAVLNSLANINVYYNGAVVK